MVNERLGIDLGSDRGGMPLPADGVHPASLQGRDLEGYFDLLARARSATYEVLTTWHDASLDTTVTFGTVTVREAAPRSGSPVGRRTFCAISQRADCAGRRGMTQHDSRRCMPMWG